MNRRFNIIIGLGLLLLLLPTHRLGADGQFWIAATLVVVTAALWISLKTSDAD